MGRVVRSAHGVNRTGSCSWKVHVKDGIITWQTQQADYPSRPLRDTATIVFVISPVVMSGCRSGPRWLMALADCSAAEMRGAFDAGIE
jgi:hypothetical protein